MTKTRNIIKLIWNDGNCKVYNYDDIIYQFENQKDLLKNLKQKLKVLE